jgi:hypothetical protein
VNKRIGILAATLLAACQSLPSQQQVLTVNDVAGRLKAYDGQVIRIRGWLKECRGIECVLRGRDYAVLSIAAPPLDSFLNSNSPAEFVLLAKVDAKCESKEIICLDRVPELHVVKVERISRHAPPPISEDQ